MKIFFGKNLGYLLRKRNIPRKDLAKHLNISVNTISNYATNISKPSIDTIVKTVEYIDIDLTTMVLVDITNEGIPDKKAISITQEAANNVGTTNQNINKNTSQKNNLCKTESELVIELRDRIKDLKNTIKFQEQLIMKMYEK